MADKPLLKVQGAVASIREIVDDFGRRTLQEPADYSITVTDIGTGETTAFLVVRPEVYEKEYIPILEQHMPKGDWTGGYANETYQNCVKEVLKWIEDYRMGSYRGQA